MKQPQTNPIWSARGPVLAGALTCTFLVLGVAVWSGLAQIESAIVVHGEVQASAGRRAISHLDGGDVAEVLVREGDFVERGALLARLSTAETQRDLETVRDAIAKAEISAARLRSEAESAATLTGILLATDAGPDLAAHLTDETALLAAHLEYDARRRDSIEAQVLELRARRAGTLSQISALETQNRLLLESLDTQEGLLSRGLSERPAVLSLRLQSAQIERSREELNAAREEQDARLEALEIARIAVHSERRAQALDRLAELESDLARLRAQKTQLEASLKASDLYAPIAGRIMGLSVFGPGETAPPGTTLMHIVPTEGPLHATLRLLPRDISAVRHDQTIMVKLQNDTNQAQNEIEAHIVSVSPDVFRDQATNRAYYRIDAAIPQNDAISWRLRPGMSVEAYIAKGAESPISRLTKPLRDSLMRAIRQL